MTFFPAGLAESAGMAVEIPGRRNVRDRLAALPGVRPVRRPVSPGSADEFDLYYVRTGRKSHHPLLIVPGGPGMASVAPYQALRRHGAAAGLDVIMVEHRGVGLSRHTDDGADLPPAGLSIEQVVDDLAAVLDDARVESAVLYGTSYGSYLAAGVGVRHPDRVHAMVLDSPVLGRRDIDAVRAATRATLWDGRDPQTAALAAKVRTLVDRADWSPSDGHLAAALYGLGGAALLDRHLDLLLAGRRLLWSAVDSVGWRMAQRTVPFTNEVDLVGPIGFRELNFGGVPDGGPLDPAEAMRRCPGGDTPFEAEPFDLPAALPRFDWPTAVVSGGRDLTTPPSVAERAAALLPDGHLVRLPTAGHSILDTRERAALEIAADVCAGRAAEVAARGDELDAAPASPAWRLMGVALGAAARVESALPSAAARLVTRITS